LIDFLKNAIEIFVASLQVARTWIQALPGQDRSPGYFYKYLSGLVRSDVARWIVGSNLVLADAAFW
jgi:hypothetical protein